MTLMKKISVINGFTFICLGLMYLHGVDGVVLLTSLSIDLQSALEQFAADCEAGGMTKAMVISQKRVECHSGNEE